MIVVLVAIGAALIGATLAHLSVDSGAPLFVEWMNK